MRPLVAGFFQKLAGSVIPYMARLYPELVLLPPFRLQLVVLLLRITLLVRTGAFEKRFQFALDWRELDPPVLLTFVKGHSTSAS